VSLLDPRADVVGGILDEQFKLPSQDASTLVDLLNSELGAFDFGDSEDGQGARERIDPTQLDRGFTTRTNDVGGGELECAERGAGLDELTPVDERTSSGRGRGPAFHTTTPYHESFEMTSCLLLAGLCPARLKPSLN
jgi:hypothetical protein